MTKLLTLLIGILLVGCSITITDPENDGEYCYLRKLYYSDVSRDPYREYYEQWRMNACVDYIEPGDCVLYDSGAYIEIEECTEVYYKKYE